MVKTNSAQTSFFRVISWVLSVAGHYLLFIPIIQLLGWIPLIGYFLATVMSVAAFIVALLWSTIMHFLVLGLAWVYYRPIFGVTMLVLVGLGVGMLLFGDFK